VFSARFAGPRCDYADNCRKVLRLLKGKKGASRRATFVSVVAIYDGKKYVGAVRGECPGRITDSMRGKNGFGYDPVFVPAGLSKTFAELSPAAKNRVSHRGRALAAAKKALVRYRAGGYCTRP
jgi:XTP/dITP diphosphohydrolase